MVHDKPWNPCHRTCLAMEKLPCSMDHGKAAMNFLHHGDLTMTSIGVQDVDQRF